MPSSDLWRAARQARLANAISSVSDEVWKVFAEVLREISMLGVNCEEDKTAVSVLAAAVHDDAAWDAVTQVRQCIEALRRVNKGKS
jgi:hypothetical protein